MDRKPHGCLNSIKRYIHISFQVAFLMRCFVHSFQSPLHFSAGAQTSPSSCALGLPEALPSPKRGWELRAPRLAGGNARLRHPSLPPRHTDTSKRYFLSMGKTMAWHWSCFWHGFVTQGAQSTLTPLLTCAAPAAAQSKSFLNSALGNWQWITGYSVLGYIITMWA